MQSLKVQITEQFVMKSLDQHGDNSNSLALVVLSNSDKILIGRHFVVENAIRWWS